MVSKALKPCRDINCVNLTRDSYCDVHTKAPQEITREYNTKIRDEKTNRFYKSVEWQRVRSVAFMRDNGLCQRCKSKGMIERARVVHHIEEVKADWSKRLDLDNLESVCHKCHNKHHKS